MSRWVEALAFALCACAFGASHAGNFPGIGRGATPREVAAWDIDVRADFKGLPPGSGSVARGQEVWEAKCASCHGVFGESNQVFNPLVGGTTADDIRTGRVASLARRDYPGRTTMMKLSQVSTLWDYINRAMPWTQPKSLTVEEVYATTAYLLNLADVVPPDFTLSDENIAQVQQRLPNRNGMTRDHAMWPGSRARIDVVGTACMKNCGGEAALTSALPDFARNAHGNLAQQNRMVGPQRGIDSARGTTVAAAAPAAAASQGDARAIQSLLQINNCTACHAPASRIVGPSWAEVTAKHAGEADYLAARIRSGGSGTWGAIPMPPQSLSEADARRIAGWLASGAAP